MLADIMEVMADEINRHKIPVHDDMFSTDGIYGRMHAYSTEPDYRKLEKLRSQAYERTAKRLASRPERERQRARKELQNRHIKRPKLCRFVDGACRCGAVRP